MKIKTFDKSTCRALSEAVEAELVKVGKKFGVSFKYTGGTYNGSEFKLKILSMTLNKDGKVKDKRAEAFKQMAHMYGFKPSDLGKVFISGFRRMEIVGLNPSAHKYPIIAKDIATGKRFKYDDAMVKLLMKENGK